MFVVNAAVSSVFSNFTETLQRLLSGSRKVSGRWGDWCWPGPAPSDVCWLVCLMSDLLFDLMFPSPRWSFILSFSAVAPLPPRRLCAKAPLAYSVH